MRPIILLSLLARRGRQFFDLAVFFFFLSLRDEIASTVLKRATPNAYLLKYIGVTL